MLQCCAIWTSMTKQNRFKKPSWTQLQKGSTEQLTSVAVQRQLNSQKQSLIIFKFWLESARNSCLWFWFSVNFLFINPINPKEWDYLSLKENSPMFVWHFTTKDKEWAGIQIFVAQCSLMALRGHPFTMHIDW